MLPGGAGDDINQKLWNRKKLKARRHRNEMKKVRKSFFKQAESEETAGGTDDKHKQFYESLFSKSETKPAPKKSKKKQGTFNKGLDRLKQSTEQAKDDKAKR